MLRSRQTGVTLTGLMVGMTISLLVLAGLASAYLLTVRAASATRIQTRLAQELRAILELMQQDMRRAGYWNAPVDANPLANPFSLLMTTARAGEPADSCLLYAYDDGQKTFGFRLNRPSVQMRSATTTDPANCSSGGWEGLNSDEVRIESLNFQIETTSFDPENPDAACPVGTNCQERRLVHLTLTGRLAGDGTVRQTLSTTLAVRNDRVFIQPAPSP